MDSTLEDASEHFKLSPVGFEMKSSKGDNLVCHSEVDYQQKWSLTIYGDFDQQPCPRKAQGKLYILSGMTIWRGDGCKEEVKARRGI